MSGDLWAPKGEIDSAEMIGLVAQFPSHFEGEAMEPLSLLKRDQLAACSLSAVRLAWSCPHEVKLEIIDVARSAAAKRNRTRAYSAGMLVGMLSDICEIVTEQGQTAFKVVKDGKARMPGHVHIGFDDRVQKREQVALRQRLLEALCGETPDNFIPDSSCACSWVRSRLATHAVTPAFHSV